MPKSNPIKPAHPVGALQQCLPTRLLSTGVHRLAGSRINWLKNRLIRTFCRLYAVDLSEAEATNATTYPSFNAFFTRALRSGSRPVDTAANTIVSPVDGRMGAFGRIESGRLFQAKGMVYSLDDLLAGPTWTGSFEGGHYATLYLAPHNYHRVHMPVDGILSDSHYVPGRLFSVNPASVRSIPRLFTRNERLIAQFDTPGGPMAMILVGAFCVGGIETRWAGRVCPPHRHGQGASRALPAGANRTRFTRGEEMGRFNLGSTVIMLFGPGSIAWDSELEAGQSLQLGRALGRFIQPC